MVAVARQALRDRVNIPQHLAVEVHATKVERNRPGTPRVLRRTQDALAESRAVGLDVAAIRNHTETEETT